MNWISVLNNLLIGGAMFCNGWGIVLVMIGALSCNGLDFLFQQSPNGLGIVL